MYPHFIDFVNPTTDVRYIVALRSLDGERLIQKYYPQLHYVQFSVPDNNNFGKVIGFIIRKLGINALKKGLDVLSPISHTNYKGQLHDVNAVNKYIMDTVLNLTTKIPGDLPNWNYLQRACAINIYKMILSAISQKDPRFAWHEMPNNNFGASFIIYYTQGNINLTSNDYVIIDKLIKAHGKGTLVEIMSDKQENTNYRKTLEKLIFDQELKVSSDNIFFSFSVEKYMWIKYNAVKYGEL